MKDLWSHFHEFLRCHGDPDVAISVDGNEILHQKDGWKPNGMFTTYQLIRISLAHPP